VCGVEELTCMKKGFLHLKYPAGAEPGRAELHALSASPASTGAVENSVLLLSYGSGCMELNSVGN